jgi:hypothetical protein
VLQQLNDGTFLPSKSMLLTLQYPLQLHCVPWVIPAPHPNRYSGWYEQLLLLLHLLLLLLLMLLHA